MNKEQTRPYRQLLQNTFSKHYLDQGDVWSQDAALAQAAQLLGRELGPESLVLDIGTGQGRDARALLEAGHSVVGVDLVETSGWRELLEKFPGRAAHYPEFFQDVKLAPGFDGIIDNGSFHHQHPDEQFHYLRKVQRLLSEEGLFLLTVYSPRDARATGRASTMPDGRFGHLYSEAELRVLMENAGFRLYSMNRMRKASGSYYIVGLFKKAASPQKNKNKRALLLAPLPSDPLELKKLNFEVTSLWHQWPTDHFFGRYREESRAASDYFIEGDFYSREGRKVLAETVRKYGPFDTCLFTGPQEAVKAAAKIEALLELDLNSEQSLEILNDKARVRKLLNTAGISQVKNICIEAAGPWREALKNFELPFIAKPRFGAGSTDIRLVRNAKDRDQFVADLAGREHFSYLLEEVLEGMQISVETLSLNGIHYLCGAVEKFEVKAPNFVEMGGIFPARIPDEVLREAYETVARMLSQAEYRSGPAHTELFLTAKGPRIVETHTRLGGLVPYMIFASRNFSMTGWLAKVRGGERAKIPSGSQHPLAHLHIVALEAGKTLKSLKVPAGLKGLARFRQLITDGTVVPKVTRNADRAAYAVITGQNQNELDENLELFKKSLEVEYA